MNKMLTAKIFTLGTVFCVATLTGFAQDSGETNKIAETRSVIDNWVQTRQLISHESSKWREQKEVMTYKIDLLKTEIETLDEQIKENEDNVTLAEEKRRELNAEERKLRSASAVVENVVRKYEQNVLRLMDKLPDPLKDKVNTFVAQIPKEGKRSNLSASERIIIVLGILNEIDKFNGSVTVVSELREVGNGETVEVQTMYIGLSVAYFVDEDQRYAYKGAPGEKGWEWTEQTEIAADISRSIAMYENVIKPATFVELPIAIK